MNETTQSKSLKPQQKSVLYAPGSKVRITQQIPQRDEVFTTTVEGTVLRQERQGSGSWFARNTRNKVWLDRLILQKADGEISVLNLDEYTHVDLLEGAQPTPGTGPLVLPSEDPMGSIT